ncbi:MULTISPECIES: HIT family protein [unclassified Pseudomonas]|uniref:HIT family protein n=1 Tax=Pseudomonas sp. A-R-26 TaxID=2832404 RepID=UPI001CBB3DB9|nr:HIT domain-containing protein [Pseudomonas sp. A-R-26]
MSARTIHSGKHIVISHCRDCDIPGYMIISLKRDISRLAELNPAESAELMKGLAFTERALNTLFSPEKIYIMRISELNHELHFHVFPRYASVTQLYLAEHNERIIDGPFFFSWTRKKFSSSQSEPTQEVLNAQSILTETLKSYFSQSL